MFYLIIFVFVLLVAYSYAKHITRRKLVDSYKEGLRIFKDGEVKDGVNIQAAEYAAWRLNNSKPENCKQKTHRKMKKGLPKPVPRLMEPRVGKYRPMAVYTNIKGLPFLGGVK